MVLETTLIQCEELSDVIEVLYVTAFPRHSPLRGQLAELRQLQQGMVVFGSCLVLRRFWFWLDIIVAIIGMQL